MKFTAIKTRHLIPVLLLWLLFSHCANAQYKSRMFENSNQTLSESEQQNITSLEQALTGYEDAYQIATTSRYLARHMMAMQNYPKAAEYYANVLKTQALDELVVVQLRREYAQVLLLLKRYKDVADLLTAYPLQNQERLLLARASIGLQQFHHVIEWLAPLSTELTTLTDDTIKQTAGIYFQAKATRLTADMMTELVRRKPNDIDLARQLTGLYIQLQDFTNALNLWSLIFSRNLIKQEQDWLLLTDLHHRQGSSEKAARLMVTGIENSVIPETSQHYYRLFEFWYRSKEKDAARNALWQSVKRSQNIEHTLLLAELLQQAEHWQEMQQLIKLSCQTILPDRFVGRINLMLGIALHKQADNEQARRAFINASLVSGVNNTARDWLKFINAVPATLDESKRLWGDCLPSDPSIKLPENIRDYAGKKEVLERVNDIDQMALSESGPLEILEVITLPASRFYGTKLKTSARTLEQDLTRKTFNLIKNLLRSGGAVAGKMHLLFDEAQTAEKFNVTIAFPYSGTPTNRSGHKVIRVLQKRAVSKIYKGPAEDLSKEWQVLSISANGQGYEPTGQARMIFLSDTSNSPDIDVELQLIIQ